MPCLSWPTAIFAEENLAEGGAEVGVEDGVDDGVEQTVDVAEPDDDADKRCREVAVVATERPQHSDDEERQPAQHECSSDDGQCTSGLAFTSLFHHLPHRPATRTTSQCRPVQAHAERGGGRQQGAGEVDPAGPTWWRRRRREKAVGGLARQT